MDIIAMEVTKEEMEKILRDRVEAARNAELDECGAIIRRALHRIYELGGSVILPSVGGKYVSLHNPIVRENNISVRGYH